MSRAHLCCDNPPVPVGYSNPNVPKVKPTQIGKASTRPTPERRAESARPSGRRSCCGCGGRASSAGRPDPDQILAAQGPYWSLPSASLRLQERNRQEVGQAVVGILLRVDIFLWAEASTAHEIVGVLEHISCYAHDIGRIERVSLVELEHTKDG